MVQPIVFELFIKQLKELFNSQEYIEKIKTIEPKIKAAGGNFADNVQRITFDTSDGKYVCAIFINYSDINNRGMFQILSYKQIGNTSKEINQLSFIIHLNASMFAYAANKSMLEQFNEVKRQFPKFLTVEKFKVEKSPLGHFDIYQAMKEYIIENCIQINNNVANFKLDESKLTNQAKNQLITRLFNKL